MEEALVAFLLTDTALAALVGPRIEWEQRSQGDPLPAIVLHLIDDVPGYTYQGEDGLRVARVQTDCLGGNKASALVVARAVRVRLSGFKGSHAGVTFNGIFQLSTRSDFATTHAQVLHRVSADYQVWHRA